MTGMVKGAILIAGPTASGKSRAALELARRLDGVIVNTDSMQVYSVLRVLTARPDDADLAAAPHRLYGHVHPSEPYSTGRWARDVRALIDAGQLAERRPIFVGGTGLYFRALVEGLSDMPEIPDGMRQRWRAKLAEDGALRLHRVLAEQDPESAAEIRASDGQRIVRALEVLEATGISIRTHQAMPGRPLVSLDDASAFVLEPDRAALHARIEQRFDAMIDDGAPAETRALARLELDPAMPAMKAIGVRELMAVEAGTMPAVDAIDRAKAATRQYAKRQMTWFRNQFGPRWQRVASAEELVQRLR